MSSSRFFRAALVLLAAPLAPAATSVNSAPLGVISADLTVGDNAVAFPLIEDDVFTATVTANTAGALAFSSGNIGALLTASRRYYAEIVTGPLEGERFDVNTAATIASADATVTLDLGASSSSTRPTLAANALTAARAVIRPHVTLASLQATFTPALTGNNNFNLADGVKIFNGSAFAFYYLRTDGQTWRIVGGTTDFRSLVIPPDASILIVLKSGGRRWLQLGNVRTNAFRKNLVTGLQSFASGFPLDLSPVAIGAAVSGVEPAGARWTGSDDASLADTLQIFSRPSFTPYSLRGDGTSWWQSGGSTDQSGVNFIGATAMTLLTRANPNPDYLVARPFGL